MAANIEIRQGNLLKADAEALVNTVNCLGVMGKGIALQFKQAFPEMEQAYRVACERGEIRPGHVQVWRTESMLGPHFVINFPTKRDWRNKARYEDIASGLQSLKEAVREHGIRSIAVPPLGCGNGGLSWGKVRPMIETAFASLPDVRVLLYEPGKAPEPRERVVRTEKPKLTRARALYISAIDKYSALSYQTTQLEIQKLAYFLQEAGEPLRLQVKKGLYGPYADNLNKVLETLEGHFIRGYDGSRKPARAIELTEGAAEEARSFLATMPEAQERLESVGRLIEGFETPYGMEVLSSVHYVATRESNSDSFQDVSDRVLSWNSRKRKLIDKQHIEIALEHLRALGWVRLSDGFSNPPSV